MDKVSHLKNFNKALSIAKNEGFKNGKKSRSRVKLITDCVYEFDSKGHKRYLYSYITSNGKRINRNRLCHLKSTLIKFKLLEPEKKAEIIGQDKWGNLLTKSRFDHFFIVSGKRKGTFGPTTISKENLIRRLNNHNWESFWSGSRNLISFDPKKTTGTSMLSVDRLDNDDKQYHNGNWIPATGKENIARGSLTPTEFLLMVFDINDEWRLLIGNERDPKKILLIVKNKLKSKDSTLRTSPSV